MMMRKLLILLSALFMLHLSGCSTDNGDMPPPSESGVADGLVIYEANPKLFAKTAVFGAISARLDEIKALGANVLWLMPIYEQGVKNAVGSPYCIKDYKKLNPAYGTLEELRLLVESAHSKGMTVILDWVANHTSWDNAWMQNKSWYTQDGSGNIIAPEGMGWADVADLNYNNTDMRKAMLEAMKHWASEANIDGFRCDYAEGVPDDFWKQAISELKTLKGDKFLMLAEGSKGSLFVDGFDIVYGWNLAAKLQEVYAGKATPANLYEAHRQEYQNVPAGKQRLRYSTNHDQASEKSPVQLYSGERGAMSAFVLATTLGGTPLIYSSQEIGYAQKLSFFDSPLMDWTANATYQNEYKKVMAVYRSSVALQKGELRTYETGKVACCYRTSATENVLVVVNTSGKTETIKTPIERAGDSVRNLMDNTVTTLPMTLTLEPYQYYILQKQ